MAWSFKCRLRLAGCAQVMKSANIKTASARKAVLAVLGSRVLGPLRSGMEARVVKSNRFNRILVRAGGNRLFWYSTDDLKRLPLTHEDIEARFNAIDEDASGVLDRGEVAQVAASLGNELNDKELNEAMEAMDEDGSGEVSLPEFIHWFENGLKDDGGKSGGAPRAAYLSYAKDDRVSLKPEAAKRLEAQMKLPTVHARAMAWIADHQDDDDFDEPLPPPPTTAQLLDRLVRPATRPRKDKSYADQFMQAPALRPATHYVVHSLHARFWVRSHSSFELFLFRGSVFLTMLGNRTQCMRCCCTS